MDIEESDEQYTARVRAAGEDSKKARRNLFSVVEVEEGKIACLVRGCDWKSHLNNRSRDFDEHFLKVHCGKKVVRAWNDANPDRWKTKKCLAPPPAADFDQPDLPDFDLDGLQDMAARLLLRTAN